MASVFVEEDFEPLVITAPGGGTMMFDPMDISGRSAERQAADKRNRWLLIFGALALGAFYVRKMK